MLPLIPSWLVEPMVIAAIAWLSGLLLGRAVWPPGSSGLEQVGFLDWLLWIRVFPRQVAAEPFLHMAWPLSILHIQSFIFVLERAGYCRVLWACPDVISPFILLFLLYIFFILDSPFIFFSGACSLSPLNGWLCECPFLFFWALLIPI